MWQSEQTNGKSKAPYTLIQPNRAKRKYSAVVLPIACFGGFFCFESRKEKYKEWKEGRKEEWASLASFCIQSRSDHFCGSFAHGQGCR